ncbi:uncharacterized protein LOC107263145 isoform X2 [Cephus cinctus]|uniref:Uncharacterized protein LOC107263145 isoform X2 n=1 Tax=Cephus cinctus TaxID=211228 RepID=A0AAJ7R8P5_CEPCN|nr:uncharacterized protein LOC107263145 isoform X2 [Cephus cinctus]
MTWLPIILAYKRDAEAIRGPYNANRQSRYVELVMVIDKKEYTDHHGNLQKIYQHCKDIVNIVNALYMPLNIFVALVGVEVWSDTDEVTVSSNGDNTLTNFLRYRRERLVKEMPNDNAQLLTGTHFEGGVVGKALKGPMCTYEYSGGVCMDHSNVVGLVAATVAHEMGHNFGMEHDSSDCECPEGRCIMAAWSGSAVPVHWSSCSLDYLALAFVHGMDYCLRNKPQKLFESPICGNGFVEPGEQCDCGLKENCNNPCCNATTCMLHSNASCATGKCCDLTTCRPKTAGTECRSVEHECDLPEYCTGQSEYCPVNVFKMDGEVCSMGKAFCYQGSCRTHDDQCRLLWGPTGTSSDDKCYSTNSEGSMKGNCGYNRVDSVYVKCTNENTLCGMLQCKHLNERLEFGMESVAILKHNFINNGKEIIACRTAIVDLGLNQVDPGLTPDGAKCGPGKMCVNQKCMAVSDLRASLLGGKACPNNCGGNGVCNSRGHCHCNRGFKPPDCMELGVGGSEDSGPAEDPNARNDFVTALYIIFLGIVPMVALLSLGAWYTKRNAGRYWKKGAMSATDRSNNGLSIKTIDRSSPMPRNIETIDSSLRQDPACASLLPKVETDERYNNNFFGQFKGFTIIPINNQSKPPEPTKPAPPPPTIPTVAIKTNIKPVLRSNTLRSTLSGGVSNVNQASVAPALPPLNPGCNARPLISSPVLAATTCTSMELIASKVPTRPAPDVPVRPAPEIPAVSYSSQKSQRPNSTPLTNVILPEPEKKPEKGSALNRIASILRPSSGIMRSNSQPNSRDDKNTNSLPRNQHHKANKVIDKEILRNLEISHPIPQSEIEISTPAIPVIPLTENEEKKNVVMRAQSMRDNKVTPRPAIHTFGSMRQANPLKRPTSIPASTRPTSPPPGPPTAPPAVVADKISETGIKIPGLPGYQNPPVKIIPKAADNVYDDCMNTVSEQVLTKIMEESPSNDNIYAVIEESVPEKNRKKQESPLKKIQNVESQYKSPKPIEATPNKGSGTDSMGLLSEIVSEISNRNFDSIYSTSTLARKKREKEEADKNSEELGSNSSLGTYTNSSHYKSPGSVYSNSASGKFNSASSTTSSGYLNPSVLNVPKAENKQEPEKKPLSALKNDLKLVDKSKLLSLNSKNPNINDDMSKELGMKPVDSTDSGKPFSSASNRSSIVIDRSSKIEKKEEGKAPAKPPLNRTKTPPNITKGLTTKQQGSDTNLKSTRQGSDPSLRSNKQNADSNLKSNRQGSDTSLKTVRQGSDTSLKSGRQGPTLNKSNSSLNKSNGNLDKQGSNTNLSTMSLKGVPCSPRGSLGKLNSSNSPDLVSSCSNSSQNSTKSPDVLGSNAKISGGLKSGQKTPTLPRNMKIPSTPPKPANVATKAASFAEKKKSPTTNVNVIKSLSVTTKDTNSSKSMQPSKLPQKTTEVKAMEITSKVNPVQKAASSKSNVASLQQKFEVNKNSNPTRTMSNISKKTPVVKTTEVGRSVSAKK